MTLSYSLNEMIVKAAEQEKKIEEVIGSSNLAVIFTEPGMGTVTRCKKILGANVVELDLSVMEFGAARQALADAKASKRPLVISGICADDDPQSPSGELRALALEKAKEIADGGVKVAVVSPKPLGEMTVASEALKSWRTSREIAPGAPSSQKPSAP